MSKNQEVVASDFVFPTKFLALKNDRICKKIIHGFCTTMHHLDADMQLFDQKLNKYSSNIIFARLGPL